ncbi:MAG: hypothetical protein AAF560_25955 [Acidobacteriota bacterium]
MSVILFVVLGLAALMLVLSLVKKLVKLAFTAITLLLVAGGIWYLSQQSPEVAESLERAKGQAADTFEEVAGQAAERAAEVMKEGAEQAADKAAELMKEGAGAAMEKAAEALQEDEAPAAAEEEEKQDGTSTE